MGMAEYRNRTGRPSMTWRRTVEKECDKAGWMSWRMARTGGTKQSRLERQCDGLNGLSRCFWRKEMKNDDDDDDEYRVCMGVRALFFQGGHRE